MKNRWDITVEQSNYDFNPFRESDHGKSFRTVGNIYEDWREEVKFAFSITMRATDPSCNILVLEIIPKR